MKYRLEDIVGKKIYACEFYGTRINLNQETFSLCHEGEVGHQMNKPIEKLSPDCYYESLKELVIKNYDELSPCRSCSKCKEKVYQFEKINYITVCTSSYCNSSCIYCHSHFENSVYNPLTYIKQFHDEGLLAEDCYFDWGGGEPTLNSYFEKTVSWLSEMNYRQRINTNAILFSDATKKALENKIATLRISVDCGTEEIFALMKGNANYHEVWNNIKKYCDVSDEVFVKYNVCNYNSEFKEIESFINKCIECGVKYIIIDAEINSYQPQKNAGPFYFTQKEFEAAHYLEKLAKEKDINVEISGYAFSVRAEYNDNGELKLPGKYYDNMDKDILSNNIYCKTFPSLQFMIEQLKRTEKPIYIWGVGEIGRKCLSIMEENNINIKGLLDINYELWGKELSEKIVMSPEEFFKTKIPAVIIMAGKYWKSMLKMVNELNYDCGEIVYMDNIYYDKY